VSLVDDKERFVIDKRFGEGVDSSRVENVLIVCDDDFTGEHRVPHGRVRTGPVLDSIFHQPLSGQDTTFNRDGIGIRDVITKILRVVGAELCLAARVWRLREGAYGVIDFGRGCCLALGLTD